MNTSPEPFSNIAVSIAEDLGVAGIITFAIFHPLAAAIIAATLLVLGIVHCALPGLADPPVPAAQGAAARGETVWPWTEFGLDLGLSCRWRPIRSLAWHGLR